MLFLLYTVHVLICLFLIMVVLLQQGKGADLSVFGGGGTMTAFGARGAATLLHKLTVFSFVGFILTTLTIGIFQEQRSGGSLMTDDAIEAPAGDEDAVDEPAPALPAAETGPAFPAEEPAETPAAVPTDDGADDPGTADPPGA